MNIKHLTWIIVTTMIFFLSSCTKEMNIGDDLVELPGTKLDVVYCDTLTIEAYSFLNDSVRSDEPTNAVLGSMKDQIFGTSTAGFYAQLRLASNNLNFGTLPQCDSIVLALKYSNVFGDTLSTYTVRVFELIENIYKDSTYYTNTAPLDVETTELGSCTKVFDKNDSITLNNKKVTPHLRIPISKSFGNKILAKSGATELSTNEEFLKFLKGIYVTVDKKTSGGGFATFDLLSGITQMTLYYHNSTDTAQKVSFVINGYSARFNVCDHYNYVDASSDFKNQVINGDKSLGNQKLYVQALGGVGIKFKIPNLNTIAKGKTIAIQKSEIVLSALDGTTTEMKPNAYLGFVKDDSTGKSQFIKDFLIETGTFDGNYNTTSKQYKFIFTRQMQRYFDGTEKNYGFKILADYGLGQVTQSAAFNPYRVVLNGPKSSINPFKLKVYYTIVN